MTNQEKMEDVVAVGIDKDKSSQYALKWAVDNLLGKGKTVTLIHVNLRPGSNAVTNQATASDITYRTEASSQSKELFLPFRCFCTRKHVGVKEVTLEDVDISKALSDYVRVNQIENLVVGATTRNGLVRKFKTVDVPTGVLKAAPDFCSVYIIAKGKVSSVRSALCSMPSSTSYQTPQHQSKNSLAQSDMRMMQGNSAKGPVLDKSPYMAQDKSPYMAQDKSPYNARNQNEDSDAIKSPFTRGKAFTKSYGELSMPDTDISFVSPARPAMMEPLFSSYPESFDTGFLRLSNGSESENRLSVGSDTNTNSFGGVFSENSDSGSWSSSGQSMDGVDAEMRRLKQELKQTMDMYSKACKEALSAKQKANELHRWKVEEQHKLEEARLAQEAALAIVEKEKAKCKAAIEAAEAAQRIAELESHKRMDAERKALKESEEKKKALDALTHNDVRYRRYSIQEIETATENFADARKIGEGGYGPVYRCSLDHTPVAVKVLRPDAAQGRSQFNQEVEVLSCIRHPNMVLLLGACPEYGCLVYEHMTNGSLDDCIFRRGNSPVLPWQLRFRIAAEIATGLLFLHQSKPEPLVHRDLKPANILLDRNYVAKISDVGLARLVPPSVADSVTQYLMTSTAGTFCYIDPEYQQTGMLGTKSDIYSLGVVLLQIITAKSPMGLTHHVGRSIEKGTFGEMLDPAVQDWPIEEALTFAKLALKCAELRRKDRPDLGLVVLPELNRLRELAEESMPNIASVAISYVSRPTSSQSQTPPHLVSEPQMRVANSAEQIPRGMMTSSPFIDRRSTPSS